MICIYVNNQNRAILLTKDKKMRAFATFEYKTCEEKCCFFKTYYEKKIKTSKQKEIMCTLNPESESWDEYVISL